MTASTWSSTRRSSLLRVAFSTWLRSPAQVSSVETAVATKVIKVSSSERSRSRSRPGLAL